MISQETWRSAPCLSRTQFTWASCFVVLRLLGWSVPWSRGPDGLVLPCTDPLPLSAPRQHLVGSDAPHFGTLAPKQCVNILNISILVLPAFLSWVLGEQGWTRLDRAPCWTQPPELSVNFERLKLQRRTMVRLRGQRCSLQELIPL